MSSLKQLQQQYDLLGEKIHRLRTALIIETDAAITFKLEKQLEAAEQEQKQIEQRLEGKERLAVTCPYRGLFAFREHDERFFFGRDAYTQKLIAAVQSRSLVAVIGASGSGKSSVVYAGVFPELRRQGKWLISSFRPGDNPFQAIAKSLIPFLYSDELERLSQTKKLAEQLRSTEISLTDVITRIIEKDGQAAKFLLFADQFEELYTPNQNDHDRRRFLDEFLASSGGQTSVCKILLTLRADFLGKALAYRPFADALQNADIKLGPMNRDELRETIERPAKALDVTIEDGLTDRILNAVGDEPGNLPLLEFALTELWNRQTSGVLTHATYEAIGGVEQALAAYAENVYTNLTEDEQTRAQRIFTQLVRPGEGTEDTRRIATRADVGEENWELVTKLADDRLVVTSQRNQVFEKNLVSQSPEDTVEVVHEALIQRWQRLREWMNTDREFRMWQERLRTSIRQWETSNYDEGALLRGIPLAEAEGWKEKRENNLSQKEKSFIETSKSHNRQRRRILIGSLIFVITILTLTLSAVFIQWQKASQQTRIAEKAEFEAKRQTRIAQSRRLAAEAQSVRNRYPQRSLLLALEAMYTTLREGEPRIPSAEQALRDAIETNSGIGLPGGIMAVSSDWYWLVTGSKNGTVWLWNLKTKNPEKTEIILPGHKNPIRKISISPDNRWLATLAEGEDVIQLWDLTAADISQSLIVLRGHEDVINDMAISSNSHWLITGSKDSTIRKWDLTTDDVAQSAVILRGHEKAVGDVEISPNNHWIVSNGSDNTVRLWDLKTTKMFIINHGQDWVPIGGFSPDGRWLVTGGLFDVPRLSDLNESDVGVSIHDVGKYSWISTIVFSPDNRWLVTIGEDSSQANLWDLETTDLTEPIAHLEKHHGAIRSTAFSQDGHWFITGSQDETVRLWDLTSDVEKNSGLTLYDNNGTITEIAISSDNRWLVTGSVTGVLRLWDLFKDDQVATSSIVLYGHEGTIRQIEISPDNHWLITSSSDNTTRLWDLTAADIASSAVIAKGQEAWNWIRDMTFSQNNHWFFARSSDKLWLFDLKKSDIPEGKLVSFSHEIKMVEKISLSSDGHWLATAFKEDNTLWLWDLTVEKPKPTIALSKNKGEIFDIIISPDSHWLVTKNLDNKTLRMWDLKKTDDIASSEIILQENISGFANLAISPNSQWLGISNADGSVQLWSLIAQDWSVSKIIPSEQEWKITQIEFSPDSRWLLTKKHRQNYIEGIVTLWDLTTAGTPVLILRLQEEAYRGTAFSPDGHWFVTESRDRTLRLWDLRVADIKSSSIVLYEDQSPPDRITYIYDTPLFSPNSCWLGHIGYGNTFLLWDLTTKNFTTTPIVLHGHESGILKVIFSLNSRWFITTSWDNTARLWDLAATDISTSSVTLQGHEEAIETLAISPDNRWLATGGRDGAVRLWMLQLDDLLNLACKKTVRNLSQTEWEQYFPGEPYRKTCPELSRN